MVISIENQYFVNKFQYYRHNIFQFNSINENRINWNNKAHFHSE